MARDPEPGTEIGGWSIGETLGQGGFGTVYRATRAGSPGVGALKIFPGAGHGLVERLGREMQALARVSHPNLAGILDHGVLDRQQAAAMGLPAGAPYLVTWLVEGDSLDRILVRRGSLPREDAVAVVVALAGALDALHASGLLHRDVKPSNVCIPHQGGFAAAVLLDVGLTGFLEGTGQTAAGEVFGTPGYMSPEQAVGAPQDTTSDVWGLAATLHEMLVGRSPFERASVAETIRAVVSKPPTFPPGAPVSEADRRVIERGLAKAPGDRFASAGALASALRGAGGYRPGLDPSGAVVASPASMPPAILFRRPEEEPAIRPRVLFSKTERTPFAIPVEFLLAVLGVVAALGAVALLVNVVPLVRGAGTWSLPGWLLALAAGALVTAIALAGLGLASRTRARSRAAVARELGVARGASSRRSLLTASLALSVDRLLEQTRRDPRVNLVTTSLALVLEDYREAKRGSDRARALEQALKLFDALERATAAPSWIDRKQKVVAFAAGLLALVGTAASQYTGAAARAVRVDACPPRALSPGERFTFSPILSKDPERLVDRCVWSVDGTEVRTGAEFTWEAPPRPEKARYVVNVMVPGLGSDSCAVAVAPR